MTALWVGLGGFAGSVARYLISVAFQWFGLTNFPFATLTVNLVGSFLMGLAMAVGYDRIGLNIYYLLVTGLLGGFTTYSAFAGESLKLMQAGQYVAAAGYMFATLAFGLLACVAGFGVGTKI